MIKLFEQIHDKLHYYFAEKNWGVCREYGPYVELHEKDYIKSPWKYRWLLVKLNWHYRILRRKTYYILAPNSTQNTDDNIFEGSKIELKDENGKGEKTMNKKTRCTVIGGYLEPLERPLRQKGIVFDVIIPACNPLAMAGEADESKFQYCKDQNMPMPMLLNIRKNLLQMLSRNPENFCQNYNLQPGGKEVRYQNDTDYIIVMNTSVGYSLYQKGNIIFSDTWPQNQFVTDVKADKSYTPLGFPFSNAFNWKYYYDKFIDAILKEYDRNHIILIRTNSAQWYMESKEIKAFDNRAVQYRNRVQEIDQYFLERTRCLCIDEHYNHIPDKNQPCAFTYSSKSPQTYKCLERCIEEIAGGITDPYQTVIRSYDSLLAKNISLKLASSILKSNSEHIKFLAEHCNIFSDIEKYSHENSFFTDLLKLKKFFNMDCNYTLSDYANDVLSSSQKVDVSLVQTYVKYMKLDINDIIAVYVLSLQGMDETALRDIVANILQNPDCLPVKATRDFLKRNIQYLQSYQYIQSELRAVPEESRIYIPLENDVYLLLDPNSARPIERFDPNIKNKVNHMKVIEDGYVCPVDAADAMCSSYAFYIERAKRGDGNRPVSIVFADKSDFFKSLNYIDYTDILENERFVLKTADGIAESPQTARCDLSFLFKENTKICSVEAGLTDQICYYILGKRLEEAGENEVYFDDTIYSCWTTFNGLEIEKLVNENIYSKLISNLLSLKLLKQINGQMRIWDILCLNGCGDLGVITNMKGRLTQIKHCGHTFVPRMEESEKASKFLKRRFDFSPVFYWTIIRPEAFMLTEKFDLDQYLHFPDFEDDRNQALAEKMLSCDAVVIHIRLGDYHTSSFELDNEYYKECFQKLLEIPDYENKKYFVFSDNINYVKKHGDEFNFDLLGDADITFVDHNKGENSYRDMQLMTLAKVMIMSIGGVGRMAAFMSKRCEQLFSFNKGLIDIFEKIGRKNKYPFNISKNYLKKLEKK